MLISDSHRFVFIHNPKCGGTTVRTALAPFDTNSDFFWHKMKIEGIEIDKAHIPLTILRDHFGEVYGKIGRYFTFALVRDPYARVVSAFNENHKDLYSKYAKGSLKWRLRYIFALNSFMQNLEHAALDGWHVHFGHFQRQTDFVFIDGERVALTFKLENWPACLHELDRQGRSEIANALREAPALNRRPTQDDPLSLLSRKSIAKINALYAEDFRNFGYQMEQAGSFRISAFIRPVYRARYRASGRPW